MRKLTIGEKLTLSNLMYVIPIVALTYLMYDARTHDIRFAEQERVGNRVLDPAGDLMEAVSLHRIAAQRAIYGEKIDLGAVAKKVEENFGILAKVYERNAVLLKLTPSEMKARQSEAYAIEPIRTAWAKISGRMASLKAPESNEAHAAVIAAIRGLVNYVGNSSNLILDPDLDTYYLTDATLAGYPSLEDRLQDLIVYAEPLVRTGKIEVEDQTKFAVISSQIRADLDRITGDIQTSLAEDGNFGTRSESFQRVGPAQAKVLGDAVGAVLAMADALSTGKAVKAEAFLSASEKALDTAFRGWEVLEPENDGLLRERIDGFKSLRLRYLLIGLMVLVSASIGSWLVGKSLKNGIMSSLQGTVRELFDTAANTSATGRHILDNSEKLSSAATQQAAALQETVSALTEINAMVGKSRDNAAHSVVVVGKSQESATKGKEAVDNMVTAIGEISDSNELILKQTEESNRKIEDIVRVINEIGTKTKVINDIVFQTKLLSFNASVEAARAGEHGKGFAVVAEEVGNLAQMSGNAAKEISDMLQASTQTVTSIVSETKSRIETLVSAAKTKVDDGKRTAHYCGEVLTSIVGSVEEVTNLVNEIATAAAEQARGVDEITKAMHQLDEVTQTNTRMSGETNEHASNLADQAGNLQAIVTRLQDEVMGGAKGAAPIAGATIGASSSGEGAGADNVVALKKSGGSRREASVRGAHPPKKAVGENREVDHLPSENDPRFEDA